MRICWYNNTVEATTFFRNVGNQLTRVAASSQKNGSLTLKVLTISITLGVKGLNTAWLQHVTLSDIVSNSTGEKSVVNFHLVQRNSWDTRWCSWLRHCVSNWKDAGSIPDGIIDIFHGHNPSSRTMALGLTHLLKEMSNSNISWEGKGGGCVGLTTLPPPCADCLEIWEPQPSGNLRVCPGL